MQPPGMQMQPGTQMQPGMQMQPPGMHMQPPGMQMQHPGMMPPGMMPPSGQMPPPGMHPGMQMGPPKPRISPTHPTPIPASNVVYPPRFCSDDGFSLTTDCAAAAAHPELILNKVEERRYTELWEDADTNSEGRISGMTAVLFLKKSGQPKNILKEVGGPHPPLPPHAHTPAALAWLLNALRAGPGVEHLRQPAERPLGQERVLPGPPPDRTRPEEPEP